MTPDELPPIECMALTRDEVEDLGRYVANLDELLQAELKDREPDLTFVRFCKGEQRKYRALLRAHAASPMAKEGA